MSVTSDKYSGGLLFRVVKSKELYYVKDDTMVVEGTTRRMDNVHGIIGFDMHHFMTHSWKFILKY